MADYNRPRSKRDTTVSEDVRDTIKSVVNLAGGMFGDARDTIRRRNDVVEESVEGKRTRKYD